MAFDETAAREFLADPRVGIFAVAAESGPPAATPVWYLYEPGGNVRIVTSASTRKAKLLAHAGAATLVVEESAQNATFVAVDLELVDVREAESADDRELASRYLEGEAIDRFVEMASEHMPDENVYTFRPTKWRFASMSV